MSDLAWWLDAKRQLVELTALERDAWHIYLGVAIQLITVAVTRWRLSQWRALLPLIVLELGNEFVDLFYEIWPPADRLLQWSASAHDVANTLVMPVILLLVARRLERQRPTA